MLLTQGIHTLDVLIALAGEPVEVKSFVDHHARASHGDRGPGVRRAASGKNGALGVVYATTSNYPGFAERIEIDR